MLVSRAPSVEPIPIMDPEARLTIIEPAVHPLEPRTGRRDPWSDISLRGLAYFESRIECPHPEQRAINRKHSVIKSQNAASLRRRSANRAIAKPNVRARYAGATCAQARSARFRTARLVSSWQVGWSHIILFFDRRLAQEAKPREFAAKPGGWGRKINSRGPLIINGTGLISARPLRY
jgi:hypothetical protein